MTTRNLQKRLKLLLKKLNIQNVTAHSFRVMYATECHAAGIPIREIQQRLGHRDLNTTARYIALTQSDLKISWLLHAHKTTPAA